MSEILVVCKKCGQMLTIEYVDTGGEIHIEKCADVAIVLVHRPHVQNAPTCNGILHSFSFASETMQV
jgi:hypothetical protein